MGNSVEQRMNDVASLDAQRDAAAGRADQLRGHFPIWLADQAFGGVDYRQFENGLWRLMMGTGLAMVEVFLTSRVAAPQRKAKDSRGLSYEYTGLEKVTIRTWFGVLSMLAPTYKRRDRRTKLARRLVPLLDEVGLLPWGGGLSPNLALDAVELATRMPYEHGRELMMRFRGYAPSTRSIAGLIDLLGPMAAEALSDVKLEDGEIVITQTDGRGLPRIRPGELAKRCKPHKKGGEHPGPRRRRAPKAPKLPPRRTRGQKAKLKRRVTVGVIYTYRLSEDGEFWERSNKIVVANLGGAEPVFLRLAAILRSLGPGSRRVFFLSDGDPHLEGLQQKHLPEAKSIVDFYHVCEYLWKAGETLCKPGTPELINFVEELKDLLVDDKVDEVISRLETAAKTIPKRGPGTKGRRERMADAIRYLTNRKPRLQYRDLINEGLEIGSGAIESAVRQVVAIRFEGPGMRWGDARPHKPLSLLCLRLSGGWSLLEKRVSAEARAPHPLLRITPKAPNETSGAMRRKELKSKDNNRDAA